MIRTILAVVALMVFATSATAQVTASIDQQHPVLRSEAVVTGDLVRIGDLVDHAGIVANVPIFRSPDLGSTGTVSADAVIEAVRPHALIGLDTAGLSEVLVTRASRPIPAKEIESRIAHAIAAQFALGKADDIMLAFDGELRTINVEANARGNVRVDSITYDGRNGRFDATIDYPTGASGRGRVRLTGRATATVETIILARALARGEVIKHGDVVVQRRPRSEVSGAIVPDIAHAVGQAARSALQPDRPLRAADLMKPEIVQRNESVTLVYQVPGIMLTVRGKAAEGGAEGDVITVLNEQTKRPVQGVVAGPGHVVVGGANPRLAANIQPANSP
jgi:flagella basal body P-ring formation protein FlgA